MATTASVRVTGSKALGLVLAVSVAVTGVYLSPPSEARAAAACTITGTSGPDVLQGTIQDDIICGEGGDDTIYGSTGDDQIHGGSGNDTISGGAGIDQLFGDQGQDVLNGDDGNDILSGGSHSDLLTGGNGNDEIDGDNGDDRLLGDSGNDILRGGNAEDTLAGGPGDDQLDGQNGDDILLGGFGSDSLSGGAGWDQTFGGPGDDRMDGGHGSSDCAGGTGHNTYLYCATQVDSFGPDPAGLWTDTDDDGAMDVIELRAGSNALAADTDDDGLTDFEELSGITSPVLRDSDGDGVLDGDGDPDKDGVTTADEAVAGTGPGNPDTDSDGLNDGAEVAAGFDPLKSDTDADGLTDAEEQSLGSDPRNADSDQDGTLDGQDSFSRTIALDDSATTFHAVGIGRAVLAVGMYVPEDARLVDIPGQRSPPVGVDAPLELESGTLTIPFRAEGTSENLVVLHYNEDTATFDQPSDQTIDLASSTAIVRTTDFSPFVVVNLDEFASAWMRDMGQPGDESHRSIDLVLAIDKSDAYSSASSLARRIAAKAVLDGLLPGDRAAVYKFDRYSVPYAHLTEDFETVRTAIDQPGFNYGGRGDISYMTFMALGEFSRVIEPDDKLPVVVMFTDGRGTYNPFWIRVAAERGVTIHTVGSGPFSTNTAVLTEVAALTGGQFFDIADLADLPGSISRTGSGLHDTDADGIADETETEGWRDGAANFYHTDPLDADSDGDGLTDGDEAGELRTWGPFGTRTYYAAYSNPLRTDTDFDGLSDSEEVGHGTSAWKADLDRDGLTDFVEVQTHSSEPFSSDMDADGYSDPWELSHGREGFDPLVHDKVLTVWDYAGEFSRGALCGDLTGFEFCEATTEAFFWGTLALGFLTIGDVRDAIVNIVYLDFVAAGLSLAALIPIAGDSAAIASKTAKYINGAPVAASGNVLRARMKDIRTPVADKIALLKATAPHAVARLENAGIDGTTIAKLASRAISAELFDKMIKGAAQVNKGGGFYSHERGAEAFLRSITPGAHPKQFLVTHMSDGVVIRRFYDVVDSLGRSIEVKHGRSYGVGRAGKQADNDAIISSSGAVPSASEVEWHFFPNANGTIGPDKNLMDKLLAYDIPYTIWVP